MSPPRTVAICQVGQQLQGMEDTGMPCLTGVSFRWTAGSKARPWTEGTELPVRSAWSNLL